MRRLIASTCGQVMHIQVEDCHNSCLATLLHYHLLMQPLLVSTISPPVDVTISPKLLGWHGQAAQDKPSCMPRMFLMSEHQSEPS